MELNTLDALGSIRKHCLAKTGALEDYPWGDVVWKVGGRLFAIWGGETVCVKSTLDKQASLVMHPAIKVASYVGRYGWVAVAVSNDETLDLAIDLIDESYEMVASKPRRTSAAAKAQAL
jgi:predicted DNA-binding protein (MmcQ/YjbR family)